MRFRWNGRTARRTPCRGSTERPARPSIAAWLAIALLVSITPSVHGLAAQRPLVPVPRTPLPLLYWVDVDGSALPFYTGAQVEEFLLTATVVDIEPLAIGVTQPTRVRLEKGGTELHAIFRHLDTFYDRLPMDDGRVRTNMRDSCYLEEAAYQLSRLLNMDQVPPVVRRVVDGRAGTLQIWVYNAVMEDERIEARMRAPDPLMWDRQAQLMYLFDAVVGNDDRTQQNILIDKNWRLWLVDHTRAFYDGAESTSLSQVNLVERGFWDGLQSLDQALLSRALGDGLTASEIASVLERRDRVVAYVQALIDARGEEAVLFDWTPMGR